jgi:hypothetical protein
MEPSVPDTSQPSSYDYSSENKWLSSTELDFVYVLLLYFGEAMVRDDSEKLC